MRCGMSVYVQAADDWGRYLSIERGDFAPGIDPDVDRVRFSSELEMALEAEELGFDTLWALEHHFTPYAMITNPLQLLTFFAGATKRIDMGTQVVVLPWHHPLRVAEEITMLQYALRGRSAFIGFGRGAARREFRQLGIDMNESQERFAEEVEIIKLAIGQERFSFKGEHYLLENITMRPRPLDPEALLESLHFVKELGLASKEALERGDTREFGTLMHEHWEHKKKRSSAMSNDSMAIGLIFGLAERGIRVPEDVSVIGMDDSPESRFHLPPLTTIRLDFEGEGAYLMNVLIAKIEGEDIGDVPRYRLPELVVRGSTAVAPSARGGT